MKLFDKIKNNRPHIESLEKTREVDLTRRTVIIGGASLLAAGLLGCRTMQETGQKTFDKRNIGVDGRNYTVQPPAGAAREFVLEARQTEVEIAPGRRVQAWTYDGKLPGTEIRVKEGERVRVTLKNNLPQDTSIHWHGLHQKGTNNMDGVPGVTQEPIQAGATFVYDFRAEPAGSFIYHPHTGLQIERGLYGALIVEPKQEDLQYDREYTVTLDDWLEGSPEEAAENLKGGGMHGGGMRRGGMGMMGRRGVDVEYRTFLINGRAPDAPFEFSAKRGERIRLRVLNPSGATTFRFAVAGHKLTITHADGLPVKPVEVETFEIAPGERYDLVVTADNPGVWTTIAVSTDEPERFARAILRYSDAQATSAPSIEDFPNELKGDLLSYDRLAALESVSQAYSDAPERRIEMSLNGGMMRYVWTINGEPYSPKSKPFEIRAGERVRVRMSNRTMVRHPMHLHGHSFRVSHENAGNNAPLKDTMIVEPMRRAEFEFLADNPGDWAFHCHHAYHLEAGMMSVFKYI